MCVTWPWPPGPGVTLSLRPGWARGVARGVAGPGLTECFISSATSPSRARMSLFRPLNMSTYNTTIFIKRWINGIESKEKGDILSLFLSFSVTRFNFAPKIYYGHLDSSIFLAIIMRLTSRCVHCCGEILPKLSPQIKFELLTSGPWK